MAEVTMKNAQAIGALVALNELAAKEFPVKAALKIRRLHKEIQGQYQLVEDVRKNLIDKYCERDKENNPVPGDKAPNGQETVKIKKDEIAAFNAALEELLNETIKVSDTLSVEDFGTVSVTPGTLLALGDLLAA